MAAPVKHTCPDIDKAIKCLKSAMDAVKENIEDRQTIRWIEIDIDSAIDHFEDLRKSNDALRTWGEELTDEIESSANYINELESKIEELEQKINLEMGI